MLRAVLLSCLLVCVIGRAPTVRRPHFSGKIVGGDPANIEDHPWQLVLRRNENFECGASILSENIAVTAAHCTDGTSAEELSVRAGSSYVDKGGSIHQVKTFIQNTNFTMDQLDFDISLLMVDPPFTFGNNVKQIALPDSDMDVPVGSNADVSGWGTLQEGGDLPEHLQHVVVKIADQKECETAYGNITPRMICASAPGKDSCQGDSGGPLTENGVLVGIVSFGYGCAEQGYPGVYTRVTAVRQWIKTNTGL